MAPVPQQIKDDEGKALGKLLAKVNQRAFAQQFSVPGGASMVSQHIAGTRPINMEHALAYATGLGVQVGQFSPRLQSEIDAIAPFASSSPVSGRAPSISELDIARAAKSAPWPYPRIDQEKFRSLSGKHARLMEQAIVAAAVDIEVDVGYGIGNTKVI